MHFVVQGERVVALAPVVADALVAIDYQRVDTQRIEPGRDRESGLAAAHHQNRRVVIDIGRRLAPLIEPVLAAEVARVALGVAHRARPAVGIAVQFLERGEQRPGAPRAVGCVLDKTNHAVGTAKSGLELEDRLNAVGSGPAHAARCRTLDRNMEVRGPRARQRRCERSLDRRRASLGLQPPGEGEDIAPVAVDDETGGRGGSVARANRLAEGIQPGRRRLLDVEAGP